MVLPKGGHPGSRLPSMLLAGETFGMVAPVIEVLLAMARDSQALQVEIAQLERELRRRALADAAVRPSPPPQSFRSAREFAAWLDLVPRQSSSGGHERLGGITKMGPAYLRRHLVVGAQAVLRHAAGKTADLSPWRAQLLREKPRKARCGGAGEQDRPHRLGGPGQSEAYRAAA